MAVKIIYHYAGKSLEKRVIAPGQWIPPRYEAETVIEQSPLVDEFGNNVDDEFNNLIVGAEIV